MNLGPVYINKKNTIRIVLLLILSKSISVIINFLNAYIIINGMSWVIATPYMYSSRKYLSNEGNEGGVDRLSVLSCSKPAQEWTPIPLQIQETDPTAESFRRDIPTPVTGRALPPRRPRRRAPLPLRLGTFQTIPRPGRLSALRLR